MKNKILKTLTPPFLRRLDHHLLINYPVAWSLCVHHLFFYGLVGTALYVLLVMFYPVSLTEQLPFEMFVDWFFIFLLTGTFAWLYGQWRRRPHHTAFAYAGRINSVRLLLNVCGGALLVFSWVVSLAAADLREAHLVGREQLLNDINTLNKGNPYFSLPSNDDDDFWEIDRDCIFESDRRKLCEKKFEELDYTGADYAAVHFNFVLFVPWNYDSREQEKRGELALMTFIGLKSFFLNTTDRNTRLQLVGDYLDVLNRYGAPHVVPDSPPEVLKRFETGMWPKNALEWRERKGNLLRNINHIFEAQERVRGDYLPAAALVFFSGVVFLFAVALLIFQNLNLERFLVSIAILLTAGC